ncbi:hypothetical protein A6R68_11757 [Neotoma lepida]|uniref:Uncharacterized protein n=1 Tax=Neotoma lepida TaxID=56216 RepID=A0A1A6FU70_NEOLE|nr:hypothetical protein A6R68_11757 [Neotoma lepida]
MAKGGRFCQPKTEVQTKAGAAAPAHGPKHAQGPGRPIGKALVYHPKAAGEGGGLSLVCGFPTVTGPINIIKKNPLIAARI